MTDAQSCRVGDGDDEVVAEHCITCGDDGVPMTVVRVDRDRGLALCALEDGSRQTVETALVEPVSTGDTLLVHAGTALVRLEAPA